MLRFTVEVLNNKTGREFQVYGHDLGVQMYQAMCTKVGKEIPYDEIDEEILGYISQIKIQIPSDLAFVSQAFLNRGDIKVKVSEDFIPFIFPYTLLLNERKKEKYRADITFCKERFIFAWVTQKFARHMYFTSEQNPIYEIIALEQRFLELNNPNAVDRLMLDTTRLNSFGGIAN